MNNVLKGKLAYKGERGYSAYETAVQNGFIGTEKDWLATLGTSNHFEKNSNIYITTTAGEKEFDLPNGYTSNSFLDVYVEGEHLDSEEYTIDTTNLKVILTTALDVIGTKVEIVVLTMSTIDFTEKFKVLSGTMESNSMTTLEYPIGMNKDNCIAIALRNENVQSGYMTINFENTGMALFHNDESVAGEITYIVVLMRID